ncbi:MAG TPA: hypothetical protein VJ400_08980, partial [Thermoplasmata archaeon]|nr:hypothetical protein [Thermoplasmata archaeon]
FSDWGGQTTDTGAVDNPDVDIEEFAAEVQAGTAFAYVRVLGDALGGGDPTWRRARPIPGGPAQVPSPPTVPVRRAGEDSMFVYYDWNGTTEGVPVGTIVADTLVQVTGRHGRIRDTRAYVWNAGWTPTGTTQAVAGGSELELSAAIPGRDLRGARYLIDAQDWQGNRDRTSEQGVRGTRASADGVAVTGSYDAWIPSRSDGWIRFAVPDGPGVSWRLPDVASARHGERTILATARSVPVIAKGYSARYASAFDGIDLDVTYTADPMEFKENLVLRKRPPVPENSTLLFEFPVIRDDALMIRVTGAETDEGFRVHGDVEFVDGRGLSIRFRAPWAVDAEGRRVDLAYVLGPDRVDIAVPASWLSEASYPVTIDPPTTYQLENDNGTANDPGENFGSSTAIGDFNGDGYADVLVGAPLNNLGGSSHGYAYVFNGPISADDSTPDVVINGSAYLGRFGWSVAAGKFNSDAYWDLLISRLATPTIVVNTEIYFGSSTGPDTTADVTFTPPATPAGYGFVVAAGNLDNANYDDVLIAEEGRDNADPPPGSNDGVVYVYMSPLSATESAPDYNLLPSTNEAGHMGRAIAVGKIDSDAYVDVVTGEPSYSTNAGRVHYYAGSHFTSGSGNVVPDATLSSQSAGERFGSALSVGNLNGDSYEDVAVGAPLRNTDQGAVYIFTANGDGTGLTTGASPAATILNQTGTENFGTSVLVVDFENDGTPGVFVGAPLADTGGSNRGAAYWFDNPLSDQVVDETITGTQNDENLGRTLSGGKFGSDVQTIVAIGAPTWDDLPETNNGRVLVTNIPESPAILVTVAIVLVLGGRSVERRRLVRNR